MHERNGIGRRRFGVQINKIAQMEKTRYAVPAALRTNSAAASIAASSGCRNLVIYRPSLCGARGRHANWLLCFTLTFVDLVDHSQVA